MATQNDNTILNKGDLKAYHQKILPYLGGNMMVSTNNSDYYSTDEKVVGVWTDGRPLYQKTIQTALLEASGKYATLVSLGTDCFIQFVSHPIMILSDGSERIYSGLWGTTSAFDFGMNMKPDGTGIAAEKGTIVVGNVQPNRVGRPILFNVWYTKTTDAANSALTTPGAYDINFPNTWPENKEIYFGNGVYGQRFTGTITASINTRHIFDLTNTGANRQPRIISCGGWWCRETNNAALNIGQNDNNQESSSILVGPAGTISLETKSANPRTNSPYDVWVTYTK